QLGLSFVALRLNVTPETVDAQHQQLLRYVLPASQNSLKVHLAEDAKRIKDNNVNSTFYMTSMRAWPAENRVDSRIYFDQNGVLSKRFGLTAVPVRITPAPSGERLNIETFPPVPHP
ncbi:TPA: TraE/TraK family type IV conjugative transfer system protein, partial [Klebsiella pneumoniae]